MSDLQLVDMSNVRMQLKEQADRIELLEAALRGAVWIMDHVLTEAQRDGVLPDGSTIRQRVDEYRAALGGGSDE